MIVHKDSDEACKTDYMFLLFSVEFEERDLSDLGDLDLSSEEDLDTSEVKPEGTQEETRSGRPTRKSAQNRLVMDTSVGNTEPALYLCFNIF